MRSRDPTPPTNQSHPLPQQPTSPSASLPDSLHINQLSMAGDEYSTAGGGGGKLKLKGSKVKDGRVDKKQKKKNKNKTENANKEDEAEKSKERHSDAEDTKVATTEESDEKKGVVYKTEAERRYEEQRKKKLNDRLRREGVKTHKERVEDLNRYLSTLSEHHDMPKIGPG